MTKNICFPFLLFFFMIPPAIWTQNTAWNTMAIQPYKGNPSYWQYEKRPVLLLGGTDDDNIFQMNHFHSHLDSLTMIHGNYIRCTMSDRDTGDLRAFHKQNDGTYNLKKWNPEYWDQFEDLLKTAQKKNIIVQIEVWDRFDHSREEWRSDPWNPGNNVNYSYEEVHMESSYPNHPGANEQPFFYSIPELENNEALLSYQQSFVKKLLSISLKYHNVLYCIDNETKGAAQWGSYWAKYIHNQSGGKRVYVTEMWDDWNVTSDRHKATIDHPEVYDYIDLSQNTQTTGHENWENPQKIFEYISSDVRPVNNVKIYGGPWNPSYVRQGKTADHGIQTFFKNIIGGYASSRFHRPPTGLGLSEKSINAIKTIRAIETKVKFWNVVPRMDLLSDLQTGEAYLAANENSRYVLYFPAKGEVGLKLPKDTRSLKGAWISTRDARWKNEENISSDHETHIKPPDGSGWIYVIYRDY